MNVGQILKSEREKLGMPLEEVARVTKVTIRYLQSIEDGRMDGLPGTIFVRGFVKDYAKTIGLDGDEIVKKFDIEKRIARPNHISYQSPLGLDEQRVANSAAHFQSQYAETASPVQRRTLYKAPPKKCNCWPKTKEFFGRYLTGRVVFFIIAAVVIAFAAFFSTR